MSATPRPWQIVEGRTVTDGYYVGDGGTHVTGIDGPGGGQIAEVYEEDDRDLILTAVNAFDALLLVAKAATAQATDETVHADITSDLEQALFRLWEQHPGWREWESLPENP